MAISFSAIAWSTHCPLVRFLSISLTTFEKNSPPLFDRVLFTRLDLASDSLTYHRIAHAHSLFRGVAFVPLCLMDKWIISTTQHVYEINIERNTSNGKTSNYHGLPLSCWSKKSWSESTSSPNETKLDQRSVGFVSAYKVRTSSCHLTADGTLPNYHDVKQKIELERR